MRSESIVFQRRKVGKPSKASKQEYQEQIKGLCEWMNRYISRLGFAPSSRGWCYALETAGAINKGEFDRAITTLADLRKKGLIPFDFVADVTRLRLCFFANSKAYRIILSVPFRVNILC